MCDAKQPLQLWPAMCGFREITERGSLWTLATLSSFPNFPRQISRRAKTQSQFSSRKKDEVWTTLQLAAICGRWTFSNLFSMKENVKIIFPSPHLVHTHTFSETTQQPHVNLIFFRTTSRKNAHFLFPLFEFPSLSDFEAKKSVRKLKKLRLPLTCCALDWLTGSVELSINEFGFDGHAGVIMEKKITCFQLFTSGKATETAHEWQSLTPTRHRKNW
jgi:hypothetical protein